MQNKIPQRSKITMIGLILFVLFSLGCAQKPLFVHQHVDPRLKPYLDQYTQYMRDMGFNDNIPHINLSIVETLPRGGNSTVGVCSTLWSPVYVNRTIYIRPDEYEYHSPNGEYSPGIERLMFHELAHCLQNIEHNDDTYIRKLKAEKYNRETKKMEPTLVTHACPSLMAGSTNTIIGTWDYLCYEQHHDLYLEELKEIFKLGVWY